MRETLADIKTRRSCRKFLPEQIKEEELAAVLEAGTYAPTGHGSQSPKMVVVQDPALRDELSRLNGLVMDAKHDPFYGAPTAVLVFMDSTVRTGIQDATLVMGNLMLAAHAIGLGSCWINRCKEMLELPEGKAIRDKWGLDGKYVGVGICVLGYGAEHGTGPAKPRKADYVQRV